MENNDKNDSKTHIDFFDVKYIIDCGATLLKTTTSLNFDPITIDLRNTPNTFKNSNISPIDNFKNSLETNCLFQLNNRSVVLIIPAMFVEVTLQSVATYLFDQFQIVSILPLYDCVASLYPLGLESGLVVDFGYSFSRISPVFSYTMIENALQITSTATKSLYNEIFLKITEMGLELNYESNFNEAIYNNLLYLSLEQLFDYFSTIGIDAGFDFQIFAKDFLFFQDAHDFSITKAIIRALMNCPIDTREILASNIVLIGGMAAAPNIQLYLIESLENVIKSNPQYKCLEKLKFACHPHLTPPHLLPLAGGFIVSRMNQCEPNFMDKESFMNFIKYTSNLN